MQDTITWTAGVNPAVEILTVSGAARVYLEARRLDLAESSLRAYRNALTDLSAVLRDPPVGTVDTRLFRQYFAEILERDYKRATILQRYEICSGLFDWLVTEGYLESNPVQAMKSPKTEKRLPRYLNDEAIRGLLAAYTTSFTGQRMRAITLTLLGTGIRIDELCGITIADLDLDAGVLKVSGKGSKDRAIPIGETLVSELFSWLEIRSNHLTTRDLASEYLFASLRGTKPCRVCVHRNMIRMCKKTGIDPPISPHVLRHTFATRFAAGCGKEHPGNIWQLRDILGHSSIQTTQIYVHTSARMLKDGFGDPLEKFTRM
ncbi:MAG: tyrosine-type recombinase/integrase [Actinobacteria bacterium]|nr:tyrosine-type recombinase/integrase [Actinomycetota bacterium]